MIFDSQLLFANQQAVTAAAASVASSSFTPAPVGIVDLGVGRNIGAGTDKLYLVVQCTTAMTDGSSDSTLTASVRTSATQASAALTGTITTITTLPAFPALSAVGTQVIGVLPPGTYNRYIDVYFTPSNGNLTTGSFTAFLASDVDLQYSYPSGFNVN